MRIIVVLQVSTIYVGGISFDTDERALQNYFSKFGNVTEVKVRRYEPPRGRHGAVTARHCFSLMPSGSGLPFCVLAQLLQPQASF